MRQRDPKTLSERVVAFFQAWLQRDGVKRRLMTLAHGETQERVRAAEDLGMSRKAPWEVVPTLVLALNDPSPEVRHTAARALTRIGEPLWLEPV
jgi:hypothetical protein